MDLYILFLPLKYKVEYAVSLFLRKRKKKKTLTFLPYKCFRIIRSQFLHKSQLIMDIVISVTL